MSTGSESGAGDEDRPQYIQSDPDIQQPTQLTELAA